VEARRENLTLQQTEESVESMRYEVAQQKPSGNAGPLNDRTAGCDPKLLALPQVTTSPLHCPLFREGIESILNLAEFRDIFETQ
jgi:hypothetical protein